jgi:purine-nucleoside phosphorylase
MTGLFEKVQEATAFLKSRWSGTPKVGMILGTGLGGLAREIATEATIAYHEIPHFPVSTAESHAGRLQLGTLAGRRIIAMEGRFHFYEGYSPAEITFPVRVMKAMGCHTLIVSNACGGLNPAYAAADIMAIEDHINLLPGNPLFGPNDARLGERWPDMLHCYDRGLLETLRSVALKQGVRLHEGVYVAVAGPNLETKAEYRFLRMAGADVVGMSTVPEVITAVHAGLKVLGLSVITDMCLPDHLEKAEVAKILAAAAKAEPTLCALVKGVLERI